MGLAVQRSAGDAVPALSKLSCCSPQSCDVGTHVLYSRPIPQTRALLDRRACLLWDSASYTERLQQQPATMVHLVRGILKGSLRLCLRVQPPYRSKPSGQLCSTAEVVRGHGAR